MKILNAMLGKGLGGIEQAFLDYTNALTQVGCKVVQIINKNAEIKKYLKEDFYPVSNFSKYDPFTIIRLKKIIKTEKPDCIITHGNRAARILQFAANNVPIISLCHNYSFKQLFKSKAIITVAEDLNEKIKQMGYKNVFTIPNMVEINDDNKFIVPQFYNPPIIGAVGRFVKKKGFDVFLKALSLLEQKKVEFKAIIGGEGEERENLEKMVRTLQLSDKVKFIGWVEDKESFYKSIDIFCLPSLHEPFGIVVLEAFKYSRPVISTKTEGPSNIITDRLNGLFAENDNPQSLADKIELLIKNEELAINLAREGLNLVKAKYSSKVVGEQIIHTVANILKTLN
ncbi:Glycosyltransferase [Candidatus Jidaibacter acanthamoeba]|uniref:Glycosyltransferase n=1 Tax=Candidatus Jidaibacter acanthamoebae TaxID=86105 RepID=A0A0C1MZ09_9RICK|nr:glycosyltransferase family 4 protein [Candidatus Jidaibacter acanthamoeba]KIE05216.1 Glycosyltransferase [Candidatus Jidaibacter acanthamoeba]